MVLIHIRPALESTLVVPDTFLSLLLPLLGIPLEYVCAGFFAGLRTLMSLSLLRM